MYGVRHLYFGIPCSICCYAETMYVTFYFFNKCFMFLMLLESLYHIDLHGSDMIFKTDERKRGIVS